MNSSVRKGRNMYDMNYSLQIESEMLRSRQHQHHVNNYYTRLVTKRIFNSVKPTPALAGEQRNLRNTHRSLKPLSRRQASNAHYITVDSLDRPTDAPKLKADDSIFNPNEDGTSGGPSKLRETSRMTDMLQNTTLPVTSRSKAGPR